MNGGLSNKKPHLFCHHTWLQKGTMEDVARKPDGTDLEEEGKSPGHPRKIAMKEVREYVEKQKEEQEGLVAGGEPRAKAVPVGILPHRPAPRFPVHTEESRLTEHCIIVLVQQVEGIYI